MQFKEQYLTYEEYKEMDGTLNEVPFNLLEYDVRKMIDERTFGRLTHLSSVPFDVKMCVFKMVDVVESYLALETQNKAVSSENTDGYSVSYRKFEMSDISVKKKELESVMETYLANVVVEGIPVLYIGVPYVS